MKSTTSCPSWWREKRRLRRRQWSATVPRTFCGSNTATFTVSTWLHVWITCSLSVFTLLWIWRAIWIIWRFFLFFCFFTAEFKFTASCDLLPELCQLQMRFRVSHHCSSLSDVLSLCPSHCLKKMNTVWCIMHCTFSFPNAGSVNKTKTWTLSILLDVAVESTIPQTTELLILLTLYGLITTKMICSLHATSHVAWCQILRVTCSCADLS